MYRQNTKTKGSDLFFVSVTDLMTKLWPNKSPAAVVGRDRCGGAIDIWLQVFYAVSAAKSVSGQASPNPVNTDRKKSRVSPETRSWFEIPTVVVERRVPLQRPLQGRKR